MKLIHIALALGLAILPGVADAHTPLIGSLPESGSVLVGSPPAISLTFAAPVRLTQVVDVNGASERGLAFAPTGKSQAYTITNPNLPAGRNEVRWKALSDDGHVMEGLILIIVRPRS